MQKLGAVAALAAAALALATASPAAAQDARTLGSQPVPVTVPSQLPATPVDFRVSASAAINIANRTDLVQELRRSHGQVDAIPQVKPGQWEIFYKADGEDVALIAVGGVDGQVREEWTGDQIAWQMARGYEGQFGHILNAPYVWIPLCLILFLGLFDFSRPFRLAHLDLLVLIAFSASLFFFNRGEIGVSVPLAYPPLIYLLGRAAWIGFRKAGTGLRPSLPVVVLAFALVFLIGFRVAINVTDSAVIDVGYAGTIGADRTTHLEPLYGENAFPQDNRPGDTYGPAAYYAYIPFELIFPWSGTWDSLPSARAAVIFFDLAAILGLFALGRRLRPGTAGRDLGVLLAFGWAACPFTSYAMQSNTNDPLIAALVIWALVAFSSIGGRAILLALATMVKFVPLLLVPLFAAGNTGIGFLRTREALGATALRIGYFAAVFIAVAGAMLVFPAIDPGLKVAWERTIETQVDRESPFSIWGQVESLEPLKVALMGATALFAVFLAFRPRSRDLLQVVALSAAVIIASQLILEHWFYLYIPWFLGPLLAAIATPLASDERESPRPAVAKRKPRAKRKARAG
jgi:hypothetical protein